MGRVHGLLGLLFVGAILAPAGAAVAGQTPPIFQPGAPGAPSRVITADEAIKLSRSSYTADDVAFMQHMIVHHAQAVEMVTLLEAQGADAKVKRLGRRIALSQQAEMDQMRGWLMDRAQPVEMPGMAADPHAAHGAPAATGHDAHAGMDHGSHGAAASDETPVMAGMLSPRQMRTLAAASGAAFDRLFLQGMIQHHQGALDMVDELMVQPDAAQDTFLSDFTTSVVADQSAEILRMQSLLSEL